MDMFKSDDLQRILRNKTLVMFGGSVVRGIYKDLVWLLNINRLIPFKVNFKENHTIKLINFLTFQILAKKAEHSFPDLQEAGIEDSNLERIFHSENRDKLHVSCDKLCSTPCDDKNEGLMRGRQYREVRYYYNESNNIFIVFRYWWTTNNLLNWNLQKCYSYKVCWINFDWEDLVPEVSRDNSEEDWFVFG